MKKLLTSTFFPHPRWPTVKFEGEIGRKDLEDLFVHGKTDSVSGLYTFEASEKNNVGHVSFIANSPEDAKTIYDALKPKFEERNYEVVSKI